MINLKRKNELNIEKYNNCIEKAKNSRIYAFSWYLDEVTENWEVLVYKDYEMVMPLPIRKKYGIKYVYQPFWVLELGIFYLEKNEEIEREFLKMVSKKYLFSEFRLNTENVQVENLGNISIIDLRFDYDFISKKYNKGRRKDIRRANEANLRIASDGTIENLIKLFRENIGSRVSNILENDYENLKNVLKLCLDKKLGELHTIKDENSNIVAIGFFLLHKTKVTTLITATDFKNRKNGANTFLLDSVVKKYIEKDYFFDFGGSNIPSIADFFNSFGAEEKQYTLFKSGILSKIK
ncbi:GNAT family N-acetyltransferase [Aureivirga marina]|uniref:GNAT family N-acetyltransferase n=1 Tax=Aureivirga marina TaxID=1182451 RepID=UPI0018CB1131|nr:GNAT family N-acetyltransferase [Aureivirga marina]